MSSAATIELNPGRDGIPLNEWFTFCKTHRIRSVGGNVYYQNEVQILHDPHTHKLHFSTYWQDAAMPDVARLAMLAWAQWGGALSADPEICHLLGELK